jgi:hypothetical protein
LVFYERCKTNGNKKEMKTMKMSNEVKEVINDIFNNAGDRG